MKLYQVDAFTTQEFSWNPAWVMIVEDFPENTLMQNIAMEMNLSETAFIRHKWWREYDIRFFTPSSEVDLCGHATLSCAHILYSKKIVPENDDIVFHARVSKLIIKNTNIWYAMEFPVWDYSKVEDIQNAEKTTWILDIREIYKSSKKWRIVFVDNLDTLKKLEPNFSKMRGTEYGNIAVTCKWDENYDYYMRCFVTDCGINEDPVTGSIECILAPLWSEKLWKTKLKSYQASQRWWEKELEILQDSVVISGKAVTIWEIRLCI